jgi:RHS repeat-associated protein
VTPSTFKYDPFGRRIYKSSSAGTSVYAYDANSLIEETNSTGSVVARYTQGPEIDEILSTLRSSTTSFYQADGLGSVTSLSNGAGALAQTYSFDSFGKQTASSGSLINPFRYTGRESDSETGLYFYRARYYDPQIGRFISEDPIRPARGGPNFYWYAGNSPTDFIDPLGLWPIVWCQCCFEFGMGSRDMWRNYRRMEWRGWIGDDKYYHCMGNCQATDWGSCGAAAAKVISFFRTDVVSRVREPGDWRNDDKANKCGQLGGDCDKRCAPFVPKSSPGKPPFPGW